MKRIASPSCRHRAGRRGVDGSAAAPGDRPWRPRRVLFLFAVAVLGRPWNSLVQAACSNGLEGIESSSGEVCCLEACGLCGGDGCGSIEGLSDKDCCTSDIIDTNVFCGDGNVAPCIIDASVTATPSPANGTPSPDASPSQAPTSAPSTSKPVSGSEAPTAAPQTPTMPAASLGPTAAPQLPVAPAPTGAPAAVAAPAAAPVVVKFTSAPLTPTTAPVAAVSPSVVSRTTSAPFERSNCTNGFPGWQSNDACCSEFCGQCGGEGCGILGSADCCYDNIAAAGLVCGQDTPEAPCIIVDGVVTPTPAPVAQGETAPPTTGPPITAPVSPSPTLQPAVDASAAPATSPTGSPVASWDVSTTAPMPATSVTGMPVAVGETLAPQDATSSPEADENITVPPVLVEEETCSNDLPGYQHGVVCCPLACGQCGGSGCENIAGTAGASDCCSDVILASGEKCDSTVLVPVVAPCIVGTVEEVASASEDVNAATGLRTSGGVGGTASVIGVACAVAVAAATTARFTR